MVTIRRILCPTDFSDISYHALTHAIAIARWYGSEIVGLHVGNPMLLLSTVVPIPGVTGDGPSGGTNRERLGEQLRTWLLPATVVGVQTDVVVDEGNAMGRILKHARARQADLIVMGTHGQGGFQRFMLGSVAEKVLRKATCPVLTVPPPATTTSQLPFTQLLCPVDFSDSSTTALAFALSLAQESRARLTLLHVFEGPPNEASATRVLATSAFHRQREAETKHRLESLIPDEVRSWCTPELQLRCGTAHQQILSVAAVQHADLIVMGVQGRNAIDLMLFGSTTQQVVRQASCPVLTLRS